MSADLWLAAFSGLAGTAVMTIVIYIFNVLGIRLDIPYLLGTRYISPEKTGSVYLTGLILHFIIGALWGVLYILFMVAMVESPKWTLGILFGCGHGFFMGVILSTLADAHPNVGKGKAIPDPGMFGNRWGKSIPFLLILLHIIFGITTTVIYSQLYHPVQMPTM